MPAMMRISIEPAKTTTVKDVVIIRAWADKSLPTK
jgi:hypothetical protein